MILLLFLIAAVVFVPPYYQKKFFAEYPTVSKGKGFLLGLGYWGILVWLTLMPILVASEYGTVATVITAIIAIAATVGVFYLIIKKRTAKLEKIYPGEKLLALREIVACIGLFIYPILYIFVIFFLIYSCFFGGKKKRN